MIDGPTAVMGIQAAGFTHVVWIPDSHLGTWEPALTASALRLIRPCREGEAVGIAAGLMLGGANPLVVIQCTGFFECGDAVRNTVHDLGLPLKLLIGVRGWRAFWQGNRTDNCPRFAAPMAKAFNLDGWEFDPFERSPDDCAATFRKLADLTIAGVVLWAE